MASTHAARSTTPQRVAIYARISADRVVDGGTKGLGVARQVADCVALAERRGWPIADVIDIDNDISAYSGKPRPGYQQLVEGLRDGTYDAVIAYAPDRLHRSPRELEDFVDVLDATGARVATVAAGDWDLTTAEGRFTARLLGNVARMESEKKSDRIARKHRELAERGKPAGGGRRPFGFDRDGVTHRPDEAAAIRDAAKRILSGKSLGSVVRSWNEIGEPPTVTGAAWSKQALRQVLTASRTRGLREHRGVVVAKADWPAILDADTADAVAAVIAERGKGSTRRNSRSYLLSGILRCGNCGHPMSGASQKRRGKPIRRYTCKADRRGCGKVGIIAEPVEQIVIGAVHSALDTPALAEAAPTPDTAHLAADLADIEARIERLDDRWTDGEIDDQRHASMTRKLVENRDAARAALDEANAAAAVPPPSDLLDRWDDLDLDARHQLLRTVLDSVAIAPTTVGGGRFDPNRISVIWRV